MQGKYLENAPGGYKWGPTKALPGCRPSYRSSRGTEFTFPAPAEARRAVKVEMCLLEQDAIY